MEIKLCLIICFIFCIVSCVLVCEIHHQLKCIQKEIKLVKVSADAIYLQFLYWLKHDCIIKERYEQAAKIDKVINNIMSKRL